MTKKDLIKFVAKDAGLSEANAGAAVDSMLKGISSALKDGDKVQIFGFGVFGIRQRKERYGIKPGTQEKILIPAAKVPFFKAGKAFKDSVA